MGFPMPWYKMHASFGPGHQSSETDYWWRKDILTEEQKENLWEDFVDGSPYVMENPVGKCEQVDVLPTDIKAEKIRSFKAAIEASHFMLNVLENTETEPVPQK